MTLPDYEDFQTGNVLLPLATSLANTLLRDSDPTLYYVLDFFSWIISNDVGPRLVAANAAISGPITSAVAQRYPYSIEPYKLENGFLFPLLAISRTSTEFTKHSLSYYSDVCQFEVMYVFPPLTAAQAENLLPAFRAIEISIRDRTVNGFDPDYTPPGGTIGQQPWSTMFANVQEIGVVRSEYGTLTGDGNLPKLFPALKIVCTVTERKNYSTRDTPRVFSGGDLDLQLRAQDTTVIDDFVQIATQLPPTFVSVSPTSGTPTGGDDVTITGTLFKAPAQVFFGSVPAAASSVVVVSDTSITCTTPVMEGPGVVDITIINGDGQQVIAADAFTFTY